MQPHTTRPEFSGGKPHPKRFLVRKEVQVENWLKGIISHVDNKIELRNKALRKNKVVKTETDMQFQDLTKQSALHQKHIMDWLGRYKGTVNCDYLFLPWERQKRTEFQQIFKEFDEDKSNSLEVDEFVTMLIGSFVTTNLRNWKKLEADDPSWPFVQ